MSVDLLEQKRAVRKEILLRRKGLSAAEREEKSRAIAERLLGLKAFEDAPVIHLYLTFQDEVATEAILENALAMGKEVAVPVIRPDEGHRVLGLMAIHPGEPSPIEKGPWNIPQPVWDPKKAVSPEAIRLWIVPGVAFDPAGRRLGYGGGYYDRILHRARGPIVALAFEVQIAAHLPEGDADIRMNTIVTEERVIACQGRGGGNTP